MLDKNYELITLIGKGTFSSIFEGKHKLKGTNVAIKINNNPNKISTTLMENETKMYIYLKKKNYKDIVSFKTFGKYKRFHYIIMDYLSYTLDKYIQNNIFSIDQNMKIFEICMYKIKKLHEINVVHRDIKPDNFMINSKGNIYIIDFGLSTFKNKKLLNNIIGTPLFCSYRLHNTPYIYEPYDDIISLFYVFFYIFSNGDLPWKNINDIFNKNEAVKLIKKKTNYQSYYSKYNNEALKKCIKQYYKYIQTLTK